MALFRVNVQIADRLMAADQGIDNLLRALRREAPVGGK